MKGTFTKMVARPAVLYGLDAVAHAKRQEEELEVAELRFSLGMTRMDIIRNEYITAQVGWLGVTKQERQD